MRHDHPRQPLSSNAGFRRPWLSPAGTASPATGCESLPRPVPPSPPATGPPGMPTPNSAMSAPLLNLHDRDRLGRQLERQLATGRAPTETARAGSCRARRTYCACPSPGRSGFARAPWRRRRDAGRHARGVVRIEVDQREIELAVGAARGRHVDRRGSIVAEAVVRPLNGRRPAASRPGTAGTCRTRDRSASAASAARRSGSSPGARSPSGRWWRASPGRCGGGRC